MNVLTRRRKPSGRYMTDGAKSGHPWPQN